MIDEMKRQKRELVYKGSILDIYKDTMQFANGKTEEWDFVSHRKGAAAVLPVLDDGRIIMVRQYRNALERETIEIPAGAETLWEKIPDCVQKGSLRRRRATALMISRFYFHFAQQLPFATKK